MKKVIIRLENISKFYSKKLILENVNLTIEKGTSIALLGNNGTGKSTLLKIISGLTNVSTGRVIYYENIKFNYIPEHFPKLNINAKQYIKYMGRIENIPINELEDKCEELVHNFHLDNMMDIPMKHLSKGSLQKVAVIQALLKKPDVLLLDEPLSGQDILSQRYFIQMVNELKLQGVAIVMSCHEMFLVNQISDIAYKIDNYQLARVNVDQSSDMDYDILCFDNSKNQKVPEKFKQYIEKLDYNDLSIRILVKKDKSNAILLDMLKEGFLLRSMRGVEYD
ncbi:ATP-binding cassette domain-containing protein [Anaerocolumna sp. MB42-C2]|uniref:ATP-binding cassette domain-containing protein n=1 Tax=Anaerocolumna sp. MB42-C2 TaxID=3070997 RepID=UPI0027E08E5B|nr:ABC transporter ATP-binding protein [Anaerocolumna sp. MB42-C2]WMJ89383.1 ABC transporter ATP-binding protein [Anaerocolumna sp. MB42-C2]